MKLHGLTTHVLDLAHGGGASGLDMDCYRLGEDGARQFLARATTDADGRNSSPLLGTETLGNGTYQLEFHAGAYYAARGVRTQEPFFGVIPVRFVVSRPNEHHHVPLLLAPWGYSVYRGN